MNESIKFSKASKVGKYAKNDTGTMVAVVSNYPNGHVAVVRLSDDSYITAPLADIEYAGS